MPEWERRGKYPGAKGHFTDDECNSIIGWYDSYKKTGTFDTNFATKLVKKMAKEIKALVLQDPSTLEQRTDEEIREVLEKERDSAVKKLQAMDQGTDWKTIKTKKGQS